MSEIVWGFLRETNEMAEKAGIDPKTKLPRTGLETYLAKIYPNVNDWVHDQTLPEEIETERKIGRIRPDYRSEKLKMIVEFDGTQHYQSPFQIKRDQENTEKYKELGYKVVRIPFFIQLSKEAVKVLFGVDMSEELFIEENHPSLGKDDKCTPACFCPAGIKRMAKEFLKFPNQYKINLDQLKADKNEFLTGVGLLESEYENLKDVETL